MITEEDKKFIEEVRQGFDLVDGELWKNNPADEADADTCDLDFLVSYVAEAAIVRERLKTEPVIEEKPWDASAVRGLEKAADEYIDLQFPKEYWSDYHRRHVKKAFLVGAGANWQKAKPDREMLCRLMRFAFRRSGTAEHVLDQFLLQESQ